MPSPGLGDAPRPGWQERILTSVEARPKAGKDGRRPDSINIAFNPAFRPLLHAAAARRDLTLSAYARRALAAFVAADLGMPLPDVTAHFAAPAPYGAPMNYTTHAPGHMNRTKTIDPGTGHGPWTASPYSPP